MAKYQAGIDITLVSAADLNASQFHFVTTAGSESGSAAYINVATGASNPAPFGVLQNDPDTNEGATVRIVGSTKLYCNGAGSTIFMGRQLIAGSDGHAEPLEYTSNASPVINAISMGHGTGDGIILECLIMPYAGIIGWSGS